MTLYLGSFKGLDDGELLKRKRKRKFSSIKKQDYKTNNDHAPNIIKAAKDGKPELAESLFLRLLQGYMLLTVVLNAWTKQPRSKMKAAPERAEALLMKVEKDLQEFGALDIKPDIICYSCVIGQNQIARMLHQKPC
jgi:hypothetical protein